MNLDEQLGHIDRDIHLAWNMLAARCVPNPEVTELTKERVRAGYDTFGAEGWRKTPYELKQDINEEIADALAYLVMLIRAEREIAASAAARAGARSA